MPPSQISGGLPSGRRDLRRDLVRAGRQTAAAVGPDAEIVDQHLRAPGGEQMRVRTAEAGPPAGAGHDRDSAVEPQLHAGAAGRGAR
jgi:hypothetical protein